MAKNKRKEDKANCLSLGELCSSQLVNNEIELKYCKKYTDLCTAHPNILFIILIYLFNPKITREQFIT
jgi:hypothetical protein